MELVRVGRLVEGQEFITPLTRRLGRVLGRGDDGGMRCLLVPPGASKFTTEYVKTLSVGVLVERATLVFKDDVIPEDADNVLLVVPRD